jgi:hypothetical protein
MVADSKSWSFDLIGHAHNVCPICTVASTASTASTGLANAVLLELSFWKFSIEENYIRYKSEEGSNNSEGLHGGRNDGSGNGY